VIILDGATDKLQLVTDAAGDIEVSRSWMRSASGAVTGGGGGPLASITTATTTDIKAAPGSGNLDAIVGITVKNNHASQTVVCTIQRTDGTNTVEVAQATLLAGESLRYDAAGNWTHYDVNMGPYPALGNIASQAEMEGGTSTEVVVTPGRLHFHPGVCKFWLKAGVTGNLLASYNVTSLTDTGTGVMGITIATDFSSVDYCVNVSVEATATTWAVANCRECHIRSATLAAGTLSVDCVDNTATTSLVKDPTSWHVSGYGDQ